MKIKCDYCGNYIDDTNEKCPECGSVNKNVKRTAKGVPTTMEELERFANEKGLPLRKMGFYIGEDFRGPRAYGIYKDIMSGDYIVYKNHSDASRSIRYKGPDEAYAVNELYQKLKSEVANQLEKNPKIQGKSNKSKKGSTNTENGKGTNKYRQKAGNVNRAKNLSRYYTWVNIKNKIKDIFELIGDIISVIMVLGPVVIPVFVFIATFVARLVYGVNNYKDDGYYEYQGDAYVSYHGKWYEYIDDTWELCDIADDIDFQNSYKDCFLSKSYSYSYDFSDFKKSEIYSDTYSSSSFSDDDSDSSWFSWSDNNDGYSWSSGWNSNWSSNWNNDNWDYDWSDWNSGYSDWDDDW